MGTAIAVTIIILAVLAAALAASGLYFYRVAIARNKKAILERSPDLDDFGAHRSDEAAEWARRQPWEYVAVNSRDGLALHGYYLEADEPSDKTVILAHGYSGEAMSNMRSLAMFYREKLGYRVLMPDARGHGRSEGGYIGFGWPEREDYLGWIDYVVGRQGTDCRIVLHGVSMGGATVLMTSGERLPGQVKAVVSDCAYTSVAEILSYQLKRLYKLPAFPLVPVTSLVCRIRAGYSFYEASALRQVARAATPILFIHGDADTFVPFGMVRQLYDECASEKELLVVPGAGHGLAYSTDREGYEGAVRRFLRRHAG